MELGGEHLEDFMELEYEEYVKLAMFLKAAPQRRILRSLETLKNK